MKCVNVPLYQVLCGGLVSVAIAVLAYFQAGRVAERSARAQVRVQELENQQGTLGFWHADYHSLDAKWRECVEKRAGCEAALTASEERVRQLETRAAALEKALEAMSRQAERNEEDLRNAEQRLAYVDFFDHLGSFDPQAIIDFGTRLLHPPREDGR